MNENSINTLSSRYLLDCKVLEMKRQKTMKDKDIPSWLSAIILTTLFFAIPTYIYYINPTYLTSALGYANGIDTYTHTVEALHAMKLIKNAMTNFWFDGASLGYPLFINSQPLPCFFMATIMLVFERWVSPLCVFRWVIVMLISILPVAWYKAARLFTFSRIQSISFALVALSIDSKLQTGFELDAYLLHGHLPQLFAMILLPLTASKIYLHGLCLDNGNHFQPVFLMCLTYLSHVSVGFFSSCLSLVTMVIFILAREFACKDCKKALKGIFYLHVRVLLYLSWWIIPLLISYPYKGNYVSKQLNNYSLCGLADLFTNGHLFDYRQTYIWITCLIAFGLCVAMTHLYGLWKFSQLQVNRQQLFTSWLLSTIAMSMFLFLGSSVMNVVRRILPYDFNNNPGSYLFGLHFSGLLLVSFSVSGIINLSTYFISSKLLKRMTNVFLVLIFACLMIRNSAARVSERVTLVEVSDEFLKTLDSIKNISKDGRLIAHDNLGTGGSWDLVNIPYLSGKPGAFIPGNKDTLSTFYLDSLMFTGDSSQNDFMNLMNLYNIQFVVSSSSAMDNSIIDLGNFKHITTIYDMQFHQVDMDDYNYGYFDFVRLPGYIDGNLKHIQYPILETLHMFSREVLFYLNPRHCNDIRKKSMINAQVVGMSYWEQLFTGNKDLSFVSWNYQNKEMDSEQALQSLDTYYHHQWSSSIVIEQAHNDSEYHVLVHVTNNENKEFQLWEHLLLKVSYHPFWRCIYFPVDEDYALRDYNPNVKQDQRKSLMVHHVTPNLMAVTIPRGKYHVIFRYRFPGIFKLLALVSALILVDKAFQCNLRKNFMKVVSRIWNICLISVVSFMLKPLRCFIRSLLYGNILLVKKCDKTINHGPVMEIFKKVYKLLRLPYYGNFQMLKDLHESLNRFVVYISERYYFVDTVNGELDSVFRGVKSPPTPPKHIKRSLRKNHTRRTTPSNEKRNTADVFRRNLVPSPCRYDQSIGKYHSAESEIDKKKMSHEKRLRKISEGSSEFKSDQMKEESSHGKTSSPLIEKTEHNRLFDLNENLNDSKNNCSSLERVIPSDEEVVLHSDVYRIFIPTKSNISPKRERRNSTPNKISSLKLPNFTEEQADSNSTPDIPKNENVKS